MNFYFKNTIILFFSIHLSSYGQDSTVQCIRKVTYTGNNECIVEITIKNVYTNGFTKLVEEIPNGYKADSIRTAQSSYSFDNNTVKFIFVTFPKYQPVILSYKLTGKNIQNIKIKGSFVYVKNNRKETLRIRDISTSNPTTTSEQTPKEQQLGSLCLNTELLSFSALNSLLDDGINVIIKKTGSISESDIQFLIDSYHERVILSGSGYTYAQLNTFSNSGAKIILDNSCSSFDIKQLVQIGGNKVIVNGSGMDNFDLETFLTAGANVIVNRTHWGIAQVWVEKYPGKVFFDNTYYSLNEITAYMKQSAGAWISTENTLTFDIRFLFDLSAKFGGGVLIASKMSYMDIINLWKQ